AIRPVLEQVVIDFAGAKDDALHVVDWTNVRRAEYFLEAPMYEFFGRRGCVLGAQQTLWRKDDERLDEIAFHLAAQHMEILRGGGEIADLDVVFGARLKKALDASAGMFRTLPFVAVRKQQHNPTGALPLRFR